MAVTYHSAGAAALCSAVLCALQGISNTGKVNAAEPTQEGAARKPRGRQAGSPAAGKTQRPRGSAAQSGGASHGDPEVPFSPFHPCLLVTGLGLTSRPAIGNWPVTADLRSALADLPSMAEAADMIISAYIRVGPGPQPSLAFALQSKG